MNKCACGLNKVQALQSWPNKELHNVSFHLFHSLVFPRYTPKKILTRKKKRKSGIRFILSSVWSCVSMATFRIWNTPRATISPVKQQTFQGNCWTRSDFFFFFTVRRFQEIFFSKSAVGKKKRKNVSSNTPFSYLLSHFKQVSHCVSAHIFPNPKSKNLK